MKKLALAGAAAASLVIGSPADADTQCPFSVSQMWLRPDGWVAARLTSSSVSRVWYFCPTSGSATVNVVAETETITSDACKGIYSGLLTAKAANATVTLYFFGTSVAGCSASQLPAGDVALPNPYPLYIIF
jgi:hypothetical protein